MKHVLRDGRFGLRLLRRNPGFTAVAVLALAIGVAANTAIFSVVYATLLAPLPYHDPDRLVMVWSRIQGFRNVTATADYLDWKSQSTVFDGLSAWTGRSVNLATGERPEQVQGSAVTPGWTTTIGYRMLLGRDFHPEEGTPGKDQVVILTYTLWNDRFGGDRGIVGRSIRLNGKPYTVVGVIEPGPADRVQNRLYIPLAFAPAQINHDFHYLLVLGRLKKGVTLAQANANMDAVTKHIAEANPQSNKGWSASVEPLQNNFLSRDTINGLWLLLGAVAFVLLIACANVANLQLARGTARQREIAMRASLGATPGQLFTQLLTESVMLAAIGGALGVALAWVLMQVIMAAMPPFTLPSEADVRLNVPVLLFTLGISLVCGVLFGCAPAWQARRANTSDTLKEGARTVAGGRHRLRRALVVAEFALALTLLAGGGIAIHSLVKLNNVDLGFRSDHLLTFTLPVPDGRLDGAAAVNSFYRQLLERMAAVPGVTSASVSTGMPVSGTSFGMPFTIVGKPLVDDPSKRPGAGFNMVSPDYYRTFGIRLSRGRTFTDRDREGSPRVAIVNDVFVKRYMPDVDPLTQRLLVEELIPGVTKLGPALEWQIVGVYNSVRNAGPKDDGFPEIDVPFWQSPWTGAAIAVRTIGDPAAVNQSLSAVVRSVDPDLPMADVKTMDQMVHESLAGSRFQTTLLGGFASIALLLAAVGIYGVMSFVVAQRTHEIGLRMALGAGRGRVLWQVMKEGLGTALGGIALGTVGAYLVGRAMRGMVYGVGTVDPLAFSVVAATLFAAALLACLVPARRAIAVDPMTALRQE